MAEQQPGDKHAAAAANTDTGKGAGKKRRKRLASAKQLKAAITKDLLDVPEADIKHMCGMDPVKEIGDSVVLEMFPDARFEIFRGNSFSAAGMNKEAWGNLVPYVVASIIGKTAYGATAIGVEFKLVDKNEGSLPSLLMKDLYAGSPLRMVFGLGRSAWERPEWSDIPDTAWSGAVELAIFGKAPQLMGYTSVKTIASKVINTLMTRLRKKKTKALDETAYDSSSIPLYAISVEICGHNAYNRRYIMGMPLAACSAEGRRPEKLTEKDVVMKALDGSCPFIAALSCLITASKETPAPLPITEVAVSPDKQQQQQPTEAATKEETIEKLQQPETKIDNATPKKPELPIIDIEAMISTSILTKIAPWNLAKLIKPSSSLPQAEEVASTTTTTTTMEDTETTQSIPKEETIQGEAHMETEEKLGGTE